jgi:hypothetical protein
MSVALTLAEQYFDHSNRSELAQIAMLFDKNSTYYSTNLGFFVGKNDIIAMQTEFHGQYQTLAWKIESIAEIKPNVVEIAFSFKGRLLDGTDQNRQGREHILIVDGLIQHVTVGL